jgi:SAM-dependent methyltransferase
VAGVTATALRNGAVTDRHFDQVYSSELRFLSRQHWTPVRVAKSAAGLLTEAGATAILDVGAGAGKFCIVGALTTTATYVGLERRAHLVEAARAAAARFGVRRVRFTRGNLLDFDCTGFDGFYLFNPFYEQIGGGLVPIDGQVEASLGLYRRYVGATEEKLAAAAPGSVVVTYHGFGGTLPGYEKIHQERAGNDRLVLWKKG